MVGGVATVAVVVGTAATVAVAGGATVATIRPGLEPPARGGDSSL